MNGYQAKRITGCLRKPEKLTAWEIDFLTGLSETPVAQKGETDDHELSKKQNHVLNEIAQRVGG